MSFSANTWYTAIVQVLVCNKILIFDFKAQNAYYVFAISVPTVCRGEQDSAGKIHNFEQKMSRVKEVMKWADDIVGESKTGYVAGTEGISLADIFFVTSYTNMRALDYFDLVSTHEIHTKIFQKKNFLRVHMRT